MNTYDLLFGRLQVFEFIIYTEAEMVVIDGLNVLLWFSYGAQKDVRVTLILNILTFFL